MIRMFSSRTCKARALLVVAIDRSKWILGRVSSSWALFPKPQKNSARVGVGVEKEDAFYPEINKVDGLDMTYVVPVGLRCRHGGNQLFPESIFPIPIKTSPLKSCSLHFAHFNNNENVKTTFIPHLPARRSEHFGDSVSSILIAEQQTLAAGDTCKYIKFSKEPLRLEKFQWQRRGLPGGQ